MTATLTGKKIKQVTYYEINSDSEPPYYYHGFDNFDLGIDFAFDDGSHWHIGWRGNDYPQCHSGPYQPAKFFKHCFQTDATESWKSCVGIELTDVTINYVNEDWQLPATVRFHFANQEQRSIVLGAELNPGGTLPLPLRYVEGAEFYVFHSKELPPIELETIRMEEQEWDTPPLQPSQKVALSTPVLIGVALVLLVAIIGLIKWGFFQH